MKTELQRAAQSYISTFRKSTSHLDQRELVTLAGVLMQTEYCAEHM